TKNSCDLQCIRAHGRLLLETIEIDMHRKTTPKGVRNLQQKYWQNVLFLSSILQRFHGFVRFGPKVITPGI
ncbi:MAG: hypothetical protein WAN28_04755, partial [Terracidiphilus sp.]